MHTNDNLQDKIEANMHPSIAAVLHSICMGIIQVPLGVFRHVEPQGEEVPLEQPRVFSVLIIMQINSGYIRFRGLGFRV